MLDRYGIGRENYVASYPAGATPELFPLNDAVPEALHHKALAEFFTDAAAGTLPPFCFLDPNYSTQSQENPQNIAVGEALIAQVVDAIGASPLWPSTLFVLTYDEHGGYYDHVPPPPAIPPDAIPPIVQFGESAYDGFARYGFRVPAVVVSPYAKPDHVSHVVYDHTSVLAMVERKWNLPALTHRDANANDLTDFLDLSALAARKPTFARLPALAKPGNTAAALACSTSGPGTVPPPSSISG
jgi:phospholipase C